MTDREMKKLQLVLALFDTVSESIKELGEVPSGHLYNVLQAHMSLDMYNQIIGLLEKEGKIEVKNHLIKWIKK